MEKEIISLITLSIILIGAIIWCVNAPYREVNLNDNLEAIQRSKSYISIHELYKDKDWNTIVAIKPYDKRTTSDERIDMGCARSRAAILDDTLFDSICILLFIRGNKLITFLSIYRSVIDFSSLSRATYRTADKIRVINKFAADC